MVVQPLLLLESGRKVGSWTHSPKLTAQKHQLMYSLTVCLCCAESKRSCCAVRLLISQACVHAYAHPSPPPPSHTHTQDLSQETEASKWEMKASHRVKSWMSRLKNKRMVIWALLMSGEGMKGRSGLMYLWWNEKIKTWNKEWKRERVSSLRVGITKPDRGPIWRQQVWQQEGPQSKYDSHGW